jgi:hypothetical protein
VGQTLTANPSVSGSGTISYQWLRGGSTISGATGSSYTLVAADQGAYIQVRVTRSGSTGSVESSQTGPVTGSSSPPPSGNNTLTLNGASGTLLAYVTSTTITSNNGATAMITGLVASGYGTGSSISLTWINSGNKNGTYNVLTLDSASATSYKYQNNVGFSNGSATVSYGSMNSGTSSSATPEPDGTITFTGGLPSGTWSILVVPGPLTTQMGVLEAMGQTAATASSALTSGSTATLNAMSGRTFNKNGTYSVIYSNATNPSAPVSKYQNNVTFSNGNATITISTMNDQTGLPVM